MTQSVVLIVGAGPTGLVLALWLTRLGVRVRIVDKNTEPGTTSRALAVQARTLELYQQIGIADAVIAEGIRAAHLNLWVKGARAARVPLRSIGAGSSPFPFALAYPQDLHERLLIARLDALGVQVERNTELLGFEPRHDGVRARLRRPDGTEEACEAAYLAGCDGASSTVRATLHIDFPGGTYSGLFYVADVEARGAAVNHELHVDLEEADFALVFPLTSPGRVRLVGVVSAASGPRDRELTFDDIKGKAIDRLALDVLKVHWFSTYRVHHRVARRFRVGRVFLLGDAAHIHSPVGGQGMNTGIGDAVNLAWKLAAVVNDGVPEALLDSYEPERIPFARRLVATTDRAFTVVTKTGPLARLVRTRVVPRLAYWLFRLPAWRRLMFRTVSQIEIHYRDSPLSTGKAGAIHGGDRLPWIELGGGRDNFAPLTARAWQVHVYGEARPELAAACHEIGLPLHTFPWQSSMHRIGVERDALYLIRPDGYVGLADPDASPARLHEYWRRVLGPRPASR